MSTERLNKLKRMIQAQKEQGEKKFTGDWYPMPDVDFDESVRVRFIPDSNDENQYYYFREDHYHFIDIDGTPTRVACLSSWGEECPVCNLARKWYKEEGDKSKNGKYYYRRRAYKARALVLEEPKSMKDKHVGTVVTFAYGEQLRKAIDAGIESIDDCDPFDYEDGLDFVIRKTKQAEYANYSTSSFVRKQTAIDTDGIEEIDLSTLVAKKPSYDEVMNLLQAHLNGTSVADSDKEEEVEEQEQVEERNDSTDDDDILQAIRRKRNAARSKK